MNPRAWIALALTCPWLAGCGVQAREVIDPSTGQRLERAELSGQHLHGEFRTWYSDGRPREQSQWEHGIPTGMRTRWHPTGHKAEEGAFVDGWRHGPWPTWRADGSAEWTGSWEGGARHGTWVLRDREGAVLETEQWERGTRVAHSSGAERP